MNLWRQSTSASNPELRATGMSAAAQERIFTCKVCGLKTHDITRPCPHWWGRWFR